MTPDPFDAFSPGPRAHLPGRPGGLSFAVKDLFDVAGFPTTAGNPSWAASHGAAVQHAPAVELLLTAGMTLVGKTVTDEMAYSLTGANPHYGTPINPAAPDRLTGGSSSGSAAAVSGRLADVALGTDTGGSVRLPASFCGLYGIRPSHGRIPLDGVVKLAPSFDAVGWFARTAEDLATVGAALGIVAAESRPRLLIAEDAFAAVGPAVRAALAPMVARLEALLGPATPITLAPEGLAAWREVFRVCQAAEAWASHGDWITAAKPVFGPGVAERFVMAALLTSEEIGRARDRRQDIAARLHRLIPADAVVCLPTVPGPAPLRVTPAAELEAFRARALELSCPAGLAGLPQISLPLATLDGAPLGLSLMAAAGGDEMLLGIPPC